ncbi:MAG TPA: YCF48-related protein [Terriglobales bacterium]|nr:YCF48-related protein [Terriglobales bacterium]
MTQVPKLVIQRLQPDAKLERHPDADLMNAFVENMLNRHERNQVLDHLAHCPDCREIVVLSFPENVNLEVGPAARARAWLSWPVLRWAGMAACIVVVGTAVTLHFESRSKSRQLIAAQSVEGVNSGQNPVQSTAPGREVKAENLPSVQALGGARQSPIAASKRTASRVPASRVLATETRDTVSLDGQPNSELQSTSTLQARVMAEPTAAPNSSGNELVPGRAKEVESAPFTANRAGFAGPVLKQKVAALAVTKGMLSPAARMAPKWALSSEGILQRSFDAGKSWETIPVDSQATFRALAANGMDIWVGGANGALYHSADAGEHWTRVQPVANGELLTADIIGVEFTDTQHGRISTSAHETWTTEDAGQTWQKK